MKKIMYVLNDIFYNRAKFQCKILGGLSYTKITKVEDLKLYTFRIYIEMIRHKI